MSSLINNIVKSPKAEEYAVKVCDSLSRALGIPNRGVKRQKLIVLNRTSMPAILVECLFADSSDSEKYNSEVIAKAIADGLVGAESGSTANKSWKLGWNKNDKGFWYCTNTEKGYYYTADNGWKYIDDDWYIFDEQGYALQNEWYYYENDGYWYYLDDECKMVHGEKDKPFHMCIDGKWYWFDEEGRSCFNS